MAKVRTLEEQKKLYEIWQQSGLSKTEFCLMNNISLSSFYSWIKKISNKDDNPASIDEDLKNKPANKNGAIKFFKMPSPFFPNISDGSGYLEIALPNGISFKVKLLPNDMDKFLVGLLTWK
jgi:hypothetical protein